MPPELAAMCGLPLSENRVRQSGYDLGVGWGQHYIDRHVNCACCIVPASQWAI